jgi:hypothetical protein
MGFFKAADTVPPFKLFPKRVKNGILFMFLGWVWHFFYLTQFFSFQDEWRMYFKHLVAAGVLIFFVIRVRAWARMFSLVLIPGLVVLNYGRILAENIYLDRHTTASYFLALLVIIFFSLSVYFLFHKETAEFFKTHNPKPDDTESGLDISGPSPGTGPSPPKDPPKTQRRQSK